MAIMRWRQPELPTFPSDILNIQREINRMFDSFFRSGREEEGQSMLPSAWTPATDVAEHDNEYVVRLELPGVKKDDVKITMRENVLTISGEKRQEKETGEASHHRVERVYGSFQRSFTLPTNVKADRIDAEYKDGVLNITLPKAEEAKPKQIEVKVK